MLDWLKITNFFIISAHRFQFMSSSKIKLIICRLVQISVAPNRSLLRLWIVVYEQSSSSSIPKTVDVATDGPWRTTQGRSHRIQGQVQSVPSSLSPKWSHCCPGFSFWALRRCRPVWVHLTVQFKNDRPLSVVWISGWTFMVYEP